MKLFKILGLMAVVGGLSACGANQPASIAYNPYSGNNINNPYNPYNPGTGQGSNTYAVPGGTKTLTPVINGGAMVYGSQNFSETAQVQAGDQIVVNAASNVVYARKIIGGILNINVQSQMTALNVSINNQVVGSGLAAQYNVSQAGTLKLSFNYLTQSLYNESDMQFQIQMMGGVFIGRCKDTAGQPMTCPSGY
jgi:hypothetical protein